MPSSRLTRIAAVAGVALIAATAMSATAASSASAATPNQEGGISVINHSQETYRVTFNTQIYGGSISKDVKPGETWLATPAQTGGQIITALGHDKLFYGQANNATGAWRDLRVVENSANVVFNPWAPSMEIKG